MRRFRLTGRGSVISMGFLVMSADAQAVPPSVAFSPDDHPRPAHHDLGSIPFGLGRRLHRNGSNFEAEAFDPDLAKFAGRVFAEDRGIELSWREQFAVPVHLHLRERRIRSAACSLLPSARTYHEIAPADRPACDRQPT